MDKLKVGDKVFYNNKGNETEFRIFGNSPPLCEWLKQNKKPLTIREVMMDDNVPQNYYAFRFKEIEQWWRAEYFRKNSSVQLVFDFAKEK